MCAIVSQPASHHCPLTMYASLLCASIDVCVLLLLLGFGFTNIFLYRDVFCFALSQTVSTAAVLVADMLFCYQHFLCVYKSMPAFCNLHSIVLNVCASLPFDKEFLFIHRSHRRCRLVFFCSFLASWQHFDDISL